VDFSEGVFRRSRDLLERPVCVCVCVFALLCQYEGKNKNCCLETSLHDS
jgi:hypothetical protein